jgi:hypothetical protein
MKKDNPRRAPNTEARPPGVPAPRRAPNSEARPSGVSAPRRTQPLKTRPLENPAPRVLTLERKQPGPSTRRDSYQRQ